MATVQIRFLDGRPFAENITGPHGINHLNRRDWIVSSVAHEFECHADDVSFVETEDGDLIAVRGEPVARYDDGLTINQQFLQAAE
jgi:hypothetical protein